MLRGAGRNADGSLQRRGSRSGLDDTDRCRRGGVKAEVGEQESGVRALAVEVDTAGKYVTFVL